MKYLRRKRRKEELIASILLCAKDGVKKTRIMYSSFLNFKQLQKYLKLAVDAGLLELRDANRYNITTKGFQFLEHFDEVQRIESALREKRDAMNMLLQNVRKDRPVTHAKC